jgi:hypothetical protein
VPIEVRRRRLYDDAASFILDAGMTWGEFWSTPRCQLDEYRAACNRRVERQRRESEGK